MAATYFCCKGATFIGFVCFIFAVRLLKVVKHKTLPLNTSSSNEIRLVGASKRVPQALLPRLSLSLSCCQQIEVEVCGAQSSLATCNCLSVLKCFSTVSSLIALGNWTGCLVLCSIRHASVAVQFGSVLVRFSVLRFSIFWLLALRVLTKTDA